MSPHSHFHIKHFDLESCRAFNMYYIHHCSCNLIALLIAAGLEGIHFPCVVTDFFNLPCRDGTSKFHVAVIVTKISWLSLLSQYDLNKLKMSKK